MHYSSILPTQDFSQQPPAQELIARDLHDVEWKFRHIFRGKNLTPFLRSYYLYKGFEYICNNVLVEYGYL
jgi:hypothetical protein